MTPQPWSEQRERLLTVAHHTCLYLVVGLFAGTVGGAIRAKWHLAGLLFALMVAAIVFDVWVMNILNAIRGNKPLGDRRVMTTWQYWPSGQNPFWCPCGRHHRFDFPEAIWSPNVGRQGTDPGGGRWCIVCPCGRGHYKFNANPGSGEVPPPVFTKALRGHWETVGGSAELRNMGNNPRRVGSEQTMHSTLGKSLFPGTGRGLAFVNGEWWELDIDCKAFQSASNRMT